MGMTGTGRLSAGARVVITLALGVALGTSARAAPPSPLWSEKRFATPLDPDAPVSMSAFSKLARELSPAVVNISTVRRSPAGALPLLDPRLMPSEGLGSGFIIHKDGFVLTNAHVVEGAQAIKVKLANEHEYDGRIVGVYKPLDVALLQIEPAEPLTVAPLGRSTTLEIGEWVIAIGNPFGLAHTVTAGIVSAKGRRDIVPTREAMHAGFIQTDASINPGNSGGPLINIRGEVVGINTAINPAGQGIGFAVPIDMIKTILGQLASGKVLRSYLGVRVSEVPRADSGKRPGALVQDVVDGSPAARAGLRKGDVIERWDGKVLDDWHDVPWFASTAGTGTTVKLGVRRDDGVVEVPVTLGAFPDEG